MKKKIILLCGVTVVIYLISLLIPKVPFILEAVKYTLFEPLGENGPFGIWLIFSGLLITLYVSFVSACIGIVIGLITAIMRLSKNKYLRYPARLYTEIIRGTPVVVQLVIIYFVVFATVDIDKTIVALIAFGINSGAYISEIVRSGIQAVDTGQMEAARSLGMKKSMAMKEIILPQAIKNILPALGNEFVALIKETSIMGFIGAMDLMRAGDKIRSLTYEATIPLFSVAVIYLILTVTLSYAIQKFEKNLKKQDK